MKNNSLIVVLVGVQSSGNIGAIARAMMNTGTYDLRLVNPEAHHLNRECLDRAMMAEPIVKSAKVFLTLKEAVSDCHQVIGTSGKQRYGRMDWKTPREFAEIFDATQKTALVFGPEDTGLSNEDLLLCEKIITIPSSQELPSLNLSHAVMIVLYEIFASQELEKKPSPKYENDFVPATMEKKEAFYNHLQEALLAINVLDKNNPDKIMRTLRTFFERCRPDDYELGLLRGICRQILNHCRKKNE